MFISYCSPVQGRMAGASVGVYKFGNWIEANMFIKVYGLHSLTKRASASFEKIAMNMTNEL